MASSLRASSPQWASEESLARTREQAVNPRGPDKGWAMKRARPSKKV